MAADSFQWRNGCKSVVSSYFLFCHYHIFVCVSSSFGSELNCACSSCFLERGDTHKLMYKHMELCWGGVRGILLSLCGGGGGGEVRVLTKEEASFLVLQSNTLKWPLGEMASWWRIILMNSYDCSKPQESLSRLAELWRKFAMRGQWEVLFCLVLCCLFFVFFIS